MGDCAPNHSRDHAFLLLLLLLRNITFCSTVHPPYLSSLLSPKTIQRLPPTVNLRYLSSEETVFTTIADEEEEEEEEEFFVAS